MFRLQTLKQKAIAVTLLFAVLAITEFFAIRASLNQVNNREREADLAQASQLNALDFAGKVNRFLDGRKDQLASAVADINRLDNKFKTLAEGGRPEGADYTISPVSRLPQISLGRTKETWDAYKNSALVLSTEEVWKDSVIQVEGADVSTATDTLSNDSLAVVQTPSTVTKKIVNPAVAQAHTLIEGQWINFYDQFNTLIKDLREDAEQSERWLVAAIALSSILNILFFAWLLILFNRSIVTPLLRIESAASNRNHVSDLANDEIGKIGAGLNQIVDQLKKASSFVQTIGEGNLEVAYQTETGGDGENDSLATSLVSMQSKLKAINDEELKRKWATEGLAKFVDILRSDNDNIQALGDRIISTLVQYTNSNQGGLYILNDEDQSNKFIELIALYAFNTKKFEQQKLKIGEGLVGQTYLEKETIYLNEIPEDYIRITSGLGDSNPRAILVVPLKVDKEVYGLVELAAFHEFQSHEIAFVEKLGETLASTLASVKTNQRNAKLLEESRMAAEAMRSQEEEMRQNMEELTATQEEMGRKEKDYLQKISQLESKTKELEQKRAELEEKSKIVVHGDDWATAAEMERTLRVQLEALKIMQKELD